MLGQLPTEPRTKAIFTLFFIIADFKRQQFHILPTKVNIFIPFSDQAYTLMSLNSDRLQQCLELLKFEADTQNNFKKIFQFKKSKLPINNFTVFDDGHFLRHLLKRVKNCIHCSPLSTFEYILYIRQRLLWLDSYVHKQNLNNDVNRRYRDNLMILVQVS